MSHRKWAKQMRLGAAEALDEELTHMPAAWDDMSQAQRFVVLDAVLEIVGQQLVLWMNARLAATDE